MNRAEITRRVEQLTRDDILAVIALYRAAGSPEAFRRTHRVFRAFKYEIVHEGETLDAKAVLVVALRRRFPDLHALDVNDVPGTKAAVAAPLSELGFEIRSRRDADIPSQDLSLALRRPSELAYNKHKSARQPAQLALRAAGDVLKTIVPPGYLVRVSGAAVNLPELPWIAVLDSDQTTTARRGIYLVYLYTKDLSHVYLSLNQGFTRHLEAAKKTARRDAGGKTQLERALTSITEETRVLRTHLEILLEAQAGVSNQIDLGSTGELGRGYEAGHMYGYAYDTTNLPTTQVLQADLYSMLRPYALACELSDRQALVEGGSWTTESGDTTYKKLRATAPSPNFDDFVPRDSTDVVATWQSAADAQIRSRKHELLIEEFGSHVRQRGMKVTNRNIGKRDLLLLDREGVEYLIEAKTVSQDGEAAVRDAIGQLFAYRHQYYARDARPKMVALFNLPIHNTWQELLQELEISWIARVGQAWQSSYDARSLIAS